MERRFNRKQCHTALATFIVQRSLTHNNSCRSHVPYIDIIYGLGQQNLLVNANGTSLVPCKERAAVSAGSEPRWRGGRGYGGG